MLAILYWWSGSAGSAHLDPKYVFARSLCSPNCNANILVIFCVLWGNGRTANMKLSTPRNHVIHLSLLKLEWEWYRCGYLKSSNKKQHRKSARQKKKQQTHTQTHELYIATYIPHQHFSEFTFNCQVWKCDLVLLSLAIQGSMRILWSRCHLAQKTLFNHSKL